MNLKSWKFKEFDKNNVINLIEEYQIPQVLAILLSQRSQGDDEIVQSFLSDYFCEESPFDILDMDKAVHRIITAIENFERIGIYGDYDADGITSTAILFKFLQSLEADVIYKIPSRLNDGYGLNKNAIDFFAEQEVKLIVTVDNGIACFKEVDYARELSIDVIITDHHKVQEQIPNALAVVNPHREDCPSAFKDYCGAGLALKLAMGIELEMGEDETVFDTYCDLACIGTVADIVSLTGENRMIVKRGLESLRETNRLGLNELIEQSAVHDINSTSLAFSVIPRINATGRMGNANKAVTLLLSDNDEDAKLYCEDLCDNNQSRRDVENTILEQAIIEIEKDKMLKHNRIIVVSGKDWHEGVIGIVASRICDRYGKPCIVISTGEKTAKGSGRSVNGFDLFKAISYCKEFLDKFGGHPSACGISLSVDNINNLKDKITQYSEKNHNIMPFPEIEIDLKLKPSILDVDIPKQLNILEPYGTSNPSPIFALTSMKLENITAVGNDKNHLRLQLSKNETKIFAMQFFCTLDKFNYKIGTMLDLAVTLSVNDFAGKENLSIKIKDIKPSKLSIDDEIYSYRIYEKYIRKEFLSAEEFSAISPNRDELATIYRYLKSNPSDNYSYLQILSELPPSKINLGKLIISLEALNECELIIINGEDYLNIQVLPTKEKIDILNCKTIKTLRGLKKE